MEPGRATSGSTGAGSTNTLMRSAVGGTGRVPVLTATLICHADGISGSALLRSCRSYVGSTRRHVGARGLAGRSARERGARHRRRADGGAGRSRSSRAWRVPGALDLRLAVARAREQAPERVPDVVQGQARVGEAGSSGAQEASRQRVRVHRLAASPREHERRAGRPAQWRSRISRASSVIGTCRVRCVFVPRTSRADTALRIVTNGSGDARSTSPTRSASTSPRRIPVCAINANTSAS